MTATAKERLTERQQEVLDFIKANMAVFSPTVRQIAQAIGAKSPHSATGHLDALERKGFIRRTPGRPRNIEVVQ
jgi:repressor LexA